MKRSRSSLISLVTILFILLMVPSATVGGGAIFGVPSIDDSRLVRATVSFGQWRTPLDRFPNTSLAVANEHRLIPREVIIRAGGAVNFVISGLHQPIIYDPGTRPGDINTGLTIPTTGAPAGVPLIDDPQDRIFRGVDPSLLPRDRVESVVLSVPGTYLVICGVHPHFVDDDMFGFVRVLP